MLALTLAMGLLLQAPQNPSDLNQASSSSSVGAQKGPKAMKSWVDTGTDASRPDAIAVSGMPELSQQEAWASANESARRLRREQLESRATGQVEARAPVWLPEFVRERVVRRWCAKQDTANELKILDRDLLVRNHGFGRSYQGFLLVERLDPKLTGNKSRLARSLLQAEKSFAVRCGAVVLTWGLLALLAFWFDRLTRGYMTGRLMCLALALAVTAPALLVLP